MPLKHKDIDWHVGDGWKKAKDYEDAVVHAAEQSFIHSGRQVKIHVVAYSAAGVKWYRNHFGQSTGKKKLDFSNDQDHEIDTLRVKMT